MPQMAALAEKREQDRETERGELRRDIEPATEHERAGQPSKRSVASGTCTRLSMSTSI